VAALFVAPEAAASCPPRSPIVSHGYGKGFCSEFIWDGCRDYTAAVALPALLKWWDWVGVTAAREYCRALLVDAVALLTSAWGTRTHAPLACYSHMACVELPVQALPPGAYSIESFPDVATVGGSPELTGRYKCTSAHGKRLQDALFALHIECPVKVLAGPAAAVPCLDGGCAGPAAAAPSQDLRCYVRISAFVYNTIDDYRRLADAVLGLEWNVSA
jgi:hypothetical protein